MSVNYNLNLKWQINLHSYKHIIKISNLLKTTVYFVKFRNYQKKNNLVFVYN